MSRGVRLLISLGCTASLLCSAGAVDADWLVLQDGARLEVRGAWKVAGRQVVFIAPDGRLSSLRADQIDPEGSARATEEAARPIPIEGPGPSAHPGLKAHRSFSDRDFDRRLPGSPEGLNQAQDSGTDGDATSLPPDFSSGLEVLTWSASVDLQSHRIKVSGTLQNGGQDLVRSIYLEVQLVDRQGLVVGQQSAEVRKASLSSGESTDFVASFPRVADFATVKFAPTPRCYKMPKKAPEKSRATPQASRTF